MCSSQTDIFNELKYLNIFKAVRARKTFQKVQGTMDLSF